MKVSIHLFVIFGAWLVASLSASGQTSGEGLSGRVTDPSGAAIVNALVNAISASGVSVVASTNGLGVFRVKLPPGQYTIEIRAPGFEVAKISNVEVKIGRLQTLDVSLRIAVTKEKVEVSTATATLGVSPESNASAIVISGKALDALPDDPDELAADLTALAGPAAGPGGGQIYIDGFTGGQLPPKSSIREIRVNQNPFSPEDDKLGYGRVEIFTKPGTDAYHGQFLVSGNDSAFNSSNPFAGVEPGYDSTQYSGNIGGPVNKHASFFLSAQRRNTNELSTVDAVVVNPDLNVAAVNEAIPNPQTRTNINPRLDYALSKNNTLTIHYQYYRNANQNSLADEFSLPSQAFDLVSTEQTLQLSDTQIIGSNTVNETRFQFLRDGQDQEPQSLAPAVNVLQAFLGGGYSGGTNIEQADHYEFQNYTSLIHAAHLVKFGARIRAIQDRSDSTAGFNGSFTFPSLAAYQSAERTLQSGAATTSGATQFSMILGSPTAAVTNYDLGLYVGDDWRVRANLTISYGLRFETQNDIHDHTDFAPRLGFSWGLGGRSAPPRTVLRAGVGIFYDRFPEMYILQAERLNGMTQQEFIVSNPNFFPVVPSPEMLASSSDTATRYEIDPRLHAPYTVQSAVSVERQLGQIANLAVSYLNTRGFDQLLTRNINAPLSVSDPTRPFGNIGNIYQYASGGVFRQNQLIANLNVHAGPKLWVFGYYVLNYANSDTAGATTFPSNQYDLLADYGRAAFAVRDNPSFGGTIELPRKFRLSPFFIATSGTPYNITLPYDLNGDSIFNDRPGFISSRKCASVQVTGSVYCTSLGTFDSMPEAGEPILPINYATGPGHVTVNVRLSKTIGLGKSAQARHRMASYGGEQTGDGGFGTASGGLGLGRATDRPFSLTFTLSVRNIFNHVNLATPNGTLGSPFFARSNALLGGPYVGASGANRRIDLQASFNF